MPDVGALGTIENSAKRWGLKMIDLDKLEADAKRVLSLTVVRKDNECALQAWADHSNNCKAETILSLIAIARAAQRACSAYRAKDNGVGMPAIRVVEMERALKAIKPEEKE